jgi:hypothetical protein
LLSAVAVPGGDRGLVAGRNRLADPTHLAAATERDGVDGGGRGRRPHRRFVETSAGPISYDYLVVATGATHSYFGHDDWAEFAPGLKRIEDATRIRRSILLAFEQAELAAR